MGKIIADDNLEGFKSQKKGFTVVQLEFNEQINASLLEKIKGTTK